MTVAKKIVRSLAAFLIAVALLELCSYAVRELVLPPKWSKLDKTDRMVPFFKGKIDYADIVEGRGARLGMLSVNSLGLRGPEPKPDAERHPGRLRVYCLGSSTTFGWGASDDGTTYPARLQEILKELLPAENIEVINAGIPGNASHAELRILREDLPKLKPDVVVLWSGWPDWSHYVQPDVAKTAAKKAHGVARVIEALSNAGAGAQSLLERTCTYRCATYLRDLVTPRPDPPSDEELSARAGLASFRPEVLAEFSGNLANMIALCKKEGATPVVLGLATSLRKPPEELAPLARRQGANRLHALEAATRADLYRSILDFDRAIAAIVDQSKAAYVDFSKLPDDPQLFIDGVHMNDKGYAALAKAVAPVVAAIREMRR